MDNHQRKNLAFNLNIAKSKESVPAARVKLVDEGEVTMIGCSAGPRSPKTINVFIDGKMSKLDMNGTWEVKIQYIKPEQVQWPRGTA